MNTFKQEIFKCEDCGKISHAGELEFGCECGNTDIVIKKGKLSWEEEFYNTYNNNIYDVRR